MNEILEDASLIVCQKLANHAHISYDYFARTSDKKHKDAVQYAWVGYGQSKNKIEHILRD
jgi:methionyl-tRNA synthetase